MSGAMRRGGGAIGAALQTVQAGRVVVLLLWVAVVTAAAWGSAQLPRDYTIDVGSEEDFNADLAFLFDFHQAERAAEQTFRWAAEGATVRVPMLGGRAQIVTLSWLDAGPALHGQLPASYRLTMNGMQTELPAPVFGRRDRLLVPRGSDAQLVLELGGEPFTVADDPRQLLFPLERIVIRATTDRALPGGTALLSWIGVLVLAGLPARLPTPTARLVVPLVGLFSSAAVLLDGPRWALGAEPALWAMLVVTALLLPLRWLYRRLLPAARIDDLLLLTVVSFALRFGGRLYPASMVGDLGFHRNRFFEAISGTLSLVALNRGVEFPYPPAPYLIVAPLVLAGFSPETALQIIAALADALSVPLVYLIARRVLPDGPAVLAAAIYVGTAATLLVQWWLFVTHIVSQLLYLVLVLVLLQAWQHWTAAAGGGRATGWTVAVAGLAALVMVGHFGYLINVSVLLGLLTIIVWWAAVRGDRAARAARGPLTAAVVTALAGVALVFYSNYLPLLTEQVQRILEGGATAVAGRAPVSRQELWQGFWYAGLWQHFGFFPLPLALIGLWLLRDPAAWLWRRLSWASLAVALLFALLPYLTLVSNSPRYLVFNLLPIAVGSAAGLAALWRRGLPARAAALGMAAIVLANSLWFWITPMVYRLRPPEPF